MSEFLGGLLVELLDILLHRRDARQRRRLRVTEAAELMRRHGQPRATVASCSVHCRPSCSCPKCAEDR